MTEVERIARAFRKLPRRLLQAAIEDTPTYNMDWSDCLFAQLHRARTGQSLLSAARVSEHDDIQRLIAEVFPELDERDIGLIAYANGSDWHEAFALVDREPAIV